MELMTKDIENKLLVTGYYPKVTNWMDAEVIVKYFNPSGAGTWLIVGGEKNENGDWILYGYAEIGYEWEWGNVFYRELNEYRGVYGLGIERDLYCENKTVKDLIR